MKGTHLRHEVMPSPNFDQRQDGVLPGILLLHYTGMTSVEAALKRLCEPAAKVSCHYLVHKDGRIVQMVDEADRAWHAGVSTWRGVTDINSHSIGIEIDNVGHNGDYPVFEDAQMNAVTALSADIVARHGLEAQHVLAHSDVAPGRKTDPGEKFDWASLWRAGVGHWVAPAKLRDGKILKLGDAGNGVAALQLALSQYGYGVQTSGQFDEQTRIVVEAFQRHFRPARVDGEADLSTVNTLELLLATIPEDLQNRV